MYSWQRSPSHSAGFLFTQLVVSFSVKKLLMMFYLRTTVGEGSLERSIVRNRYHEGGKRITLLGAEREGNRYRGRGRDRYH